jgi:hypothetical protein
LLLLLAVLVAVEVVMELKVLESLRATLHLQAVVEVVLASDIYLMAVEAVAVEVVTQVDVVVTLLDMLIIAIHVVVLHEVN